MKRICSALLSVFQLLLLTAIVTLIWLEGKFMGVMRYMANKNRLWNQAFWANWLPAIVVVGTVAILVWVAAILIRHNTRIKKRLRLQLALLAFSSMVAATFAVIADTSMIRSYYFIVIILIVVSLLQLIKVVGCYERYYLV